MTTTGNSIPAYNGTFCLVQSKTNPCVFTDGCTNHWTLTLNGGATDIYMWDDKAIEFHRCKVCGCVTHWAPVDKKHDRMGVNARLMAPEVLAQARVRFLDGAVTEKYLVE